MKKLIVFSLVLAIMISLVGIPVEAKSDSAKGAVKADLTELGTESHIVGTVIFNTTASGTLIVVIKVDDLPNLENYDVRVWVNPREYRYTFVDVLNTDADGYGNVQLKVNLPSITDPTIGVWVVFRQSMAGQTMPCYSTNYPIQVIVPLK